MGNNGVGVSVRVLLITAVVATGLVHHAVHGLEVGGRDLARIADVSPPDLDTSDPAGRQERDLSRWLYAFERTVFGDRHGLYMGFGLALVALLAAAWGLAVQRLAHDVAAPEGPTLGIPIGYVACALTAALPFCADGAAGPAGHVWLLGAVVFAVLVNAACLRPGPVTLAVAPFVATFAFADSLGPAFMLSTPLVAAVRSEARATLARPPIAASFAVLAAVTAALWLWRGTPVATRDVLGDAPGPITTLVRHGLLLVAPLAEGAVQREAVFRISFIAVLVLLAPLGHVLARPGQRALALAAAGGLLAALVATAHGPALPTSGADLRVLLAPGLFLVLVLAVCVDATRGRGTQAEAIALSLAFFFVGLSFLAGRVWIDRRQVEVLPEEGTLISQDLNRIPRDYHDIVLVGTAADAPRAGLEWALPARRAAPWSPSPASSTLRLAPNGAYDRLPSGLLARGRRVFVGEWRPRVIYALQTRPRNWTIAPLLAAELAAEPRIRLVSPANEAALAVKRPTTIEEDLTFTFETVPGRPIGKDERFIFYGIYEGGFNPKGRQQFTARMLAPAVLKSERVADGSTRWYWRVSIRPGEGHDGITFEDPDLDIAGKPFWWTVGILPLGDDVERDAHGHIQPRVRYAPRDVAQTARIWFE